MVTQPICGEIRRRRYPITVEGSYIGEVKKRLEISNSKRYDSYAWLPCTECGRPRWVSLRAGKPINTICKSCCKKGQRNIQWKGGRILNHGYIKILNPTHHRADKQGYVWEHIIIWEQANGKPLPDGWEVHHLNGIRSDNRPLNLKGLPSRKHKLILVAMAKRIQELEALLNGQGQLV